MAAKKTSKAGGKPLMVLDLAAHTLCDLVPGGMSEEEHTALVEDIRTHGVRQPIMLYEGKVLDGRARYRACKSVGIECPTAEFKGTEAEAHHFVLSLNLHRRTLSGMQKALAVAEEYRRSVNTDGPKPSQETISKRYGVSKQTLSLCLKALDSKNTMLLTRMRRGEVTRGELEEEFYDRETANTRTDAGTTAPADNNEDLFGSAPVPSNVVPIDRAAAPRTNNVVGTRPAHPERRAQETPASVAVSQFKALSEQARCEFVRMAWPWLELPVAAHQTVMKAKNGKHPGTVALAAAPAKAVAKARRAG